MEARYSSTEALALVLAAFAAGAAGLTVGYIVGLARAPRAETSTTTKRESPSSENGEHERGRFACLEEELRKSETEISKLRGTAPVALPRLEDLRAQVGPLLEPEHANPATEIRGNRGPKRCTGDRQGLSGPPAGVLRGVVDKEKR